MHSRSTSSTDRPARARRRWLLAATSLAWSRAAWALAPARQRVVLSLTGKVTRRNAADQADFDMDMLAALPQHQFTTLTPWDKTPRQFSGPLLKDVLGAAGAQGDMLRAVALNDYVVNIPVDDAERFEVIIALLVDGQPMRVRDRGPLFIVYPYDADPALRTVRYFSRSVWQLRRIDVQ